jgi:16S rRNA (cytidine1402-2'-O)-methyltransferase
MRRFRETVRGEIVVVIGPAREAASQDIGFAVDALRGLVRAGARPRAAASIVSALTGVPANELYRGITGRDPRR